MSLKLSKTAVKALAKVASSVSSVDGTISLDEVDDSGQLMLSLEYVDKDKKKRSEVIALKQDLYDFELEKFCRSANSASNEDKRIIAQCVNYYFGGLINLDNPQFSKNALSDAIAQRREDNFQQAGRTSEIEYVDGLNWYVREALQDRYEQVFNNPDQPEPKLTIGYTATKNQSLSAEDDDNLKDIDYVITDPKNLDVVLKKIFQEIGLVPSQAQRLG